MKLETPVIVPASVTEEQPRLAPRSSQEPPNWLRFLALGSAAGVLCFGLAGLARSPARPTHKTQATPSDREETRPVAVLTQP